MGAWIEIRGRTKVQGCDSGAPYAGAWIVIDSFSSVAIWAMALPIRERELQYPQRQIPIFCISSLPIWERELKFIISHIFGTLYERSLCGDVNCNKTVSYYLHGVPYAGAWIVKCIRQYQDLWGAPYMGVWIEINLKIAPIIALLRWNVNCNGFVIQHSFRFQDNLLLECEL